MSPNWRHCSILPKHTQVTTEIIDIAREIQTDPFVHTLTTNNMDDPSAKLKIRPVKNIKLYITFSFFIY
tara:strand:- start:2693 stop:2899 length:207 start_codon:yes stop_codon:yes gene_type:complete